MTLYQFRIFVAIAKSGNLTKAAVELRTSQPAIWHQIKLLEEARGAKLYLRTARGIELTDAGRILLGKIAPILDLVAKLKDNQDKPSTESRVSREVLRIGGIESASAHLLPAALAQFKVRFPNVALEFRTRTSDHLERMVLDGVMDLAVTGRAAAAVELRCEPLRAEKVALFVPVDHRLAKCKNLRLADVLVEPFILRGGRGGTGVTDRALQRLRDQGLEIKVAMYCDGPTAIKAAVAQGMGVGMVFEESLKAEVAAGKFKILEVPGLNLAGESYIISSKCRPLSPLAQEFLTLLQRAVTKQRSVADARIRPSSLPERYQPIIGDALLAPSPR
jgi:DNA-binding transcriptional LysR family regulator